MTKLTATLPDGTTATRGTKRTYTHVVAVRFDQDQLRRDYEERARYLQDYADDPRSPWTQEEVDSTLARDLAEIAELADRPWTSYAWSGRYDLAVKRAEEARKIGHFGDVRIVPVNS